MAWGGFEKCGCLVVACSHPDPVELGKDVARMRRAGLSVREVTADFVRQNFTVPERCPHRPQQAGLFGGVK